MPVFAKNKPALQKTSGKAAKTPFFGVQAKLKTGTPGDRYETEADNVAARVVQNTGNSGIKTPAVQAKPLAKSISTGVQLKPLEEESVQAKADDELQMQEEEESIQAKAEDEETVQSKEDEELQSKAEEEESVQTRAEEEEVQMRAGTTPRNTDISSELQSSRGAGSALPEASRNQMEAGFGTDLSDVRVHTDQRAQRMAQDIGAQAFTSGSDIYFNQGRFNPGTAQGDALLAHELTHTIQQGAVDPQQTPQSTANGSTSATATSTTEVDSVSENAITSPNSETPANAEAAVHHQEEKPQNAEAQTGEAQTAATPYPRIPQEDPAFQQAENQVEDRAETAQTTQPASQAAAAASAAAPAASNEQLSEAQAGQVAVMEEQEPGTFDAVAFKARLMERIAAMQLPANEEEADDFENNNNIDEVTADGTAMASAERQQAAGAIDQATQTEPNPDAVPARDVQPLPEPEFGSPPAPVRAAQAMPAPRPEDQVSAPLQENMQSIDSEMANNQVTDEMLANSNEPGFTQALDSKQEAQTHTEQAPQEFRQTEQNSLAATREQAQNSSSAELQAMHNSRTGALGTMQTQQETGAQSDSAERERIAGEINRIFEATKTDVETLLADLEAEVERRFEAAATRAKKVFEDYVERKMDAYKDERYSGVGGALTWVGDAFTGLPDEVNAFFEEGRNKYIEAMDGELTTIAEYIAQKLTEAKQRIAQGKQDVATFVESQPEALRGIAQEAAENIQEQFDSLEEDVNSKQDELIDSLAQQYQDSLAEVDARIEEMQAANRGLIDMAMGLVMGIINTIIAIKNMLTNLLSAALEAIGAIISDPIGFLSNLIRGVKEGFVNFGNNIMRHLMSGLVTWLTGALGPMGITIPEDIFSLKGIFSLVMQVLGLTWDYMRQKAVKLLGEPVVQALETGFELFQIIRTEGIAGIWEYLKEQFNDLKETVIDSIQEMIISTVVDAGIKWVLGLMSPAGAFVKAAMMIIDIVKFFIERGSQIMELINAFIDGVKAVAAGNVGVIATKIETALGKAVPVIIGFLASLLGISGLAKKVQKLIGKIRKRIDKAIDKLILKAKKAFSKLVRKGKKAAGKFIDWLGIKKRFKTKDGKNHKLFLEETGGKPQLMVQSEKQQVGDRLTKAKVETQAMPDGEIKTNRIAAEGRITNYLSETRAILQKIKTEEAKSAPESAKIEGWKKEIEQKFNSIAGDLETIGVEPGTVGTGDNPMLQELGKEYVSKDHTTLNSYANGKQTLLETSGYHYSTSASNKKYIRRKEANDSVPQLSFDAEGKLQLGSSSSSSEPEHKNYIPDKITKTETARGYEVVYTTLTDTGKKGPNFQINITHAETLAANEDENITRHVSGKNLKLKESGGARGVTDSATAGFHNAHLIADRFGGSGSNSAENIHPSTPRYNTKDMKSKEDAIARILESGSKDKNKFNLDVSARIVKEKENSAALLNALNKEAKKDNAQSVPDIETALKRDLLTLIRPDLRELPGKFMSVNYDLDGITTYTDGTNKPVSADLAVKEDTEYNTKILEIIKRK